MLGINSWTYTVYLLKIYQIYNFYTAKDIYSKKIIIKIENKYGILKENRYINLTNLLGEKPVRKLESLSVYEYSRLLN